MISFFTVALHLLDPSLLQWIFWILHLAEPDSYLTHETPISTRKAPLPWSSSRTKNMEKRGMNEERWSGNFFIVYYCYNFSCYLIKNFKKSLSYMLITYKFYILEMQGNNWWVRSQICYDSMYVKIDGQIKQSKELNWHPIQRLIYCILKLKQGKKRCIIALLDLTIINIYANSFPRKSLFLATSVVETRFSLSRWTSLFWILTINTR